MKTRNVSKLNVGYINDCHPVTIIQINSKSLESQILGLLSGILNAYKTKLYILGPTLSCLPSFFGVPSVLARETLYRYTNSCLKLIGNRAGGLHGTPYMKKM